MMGENNIIPPEVELKIFCNTLGRNALEKRRTWPYSFTKGTNTSFGMVVQSLFTKTGFPWTEYVGQKVAELSPKNANAHFNLGIIFMEESFEKGCRKKFFGRET